MSAAPVKMTTTETTRLQSPPEPIQLRSDVSVELVQHVGSDQVIAAAARVSTGASGEPGADDGLIKYLLKHKHGSPFEHGSVTVRVEAPIFVAREWMRHRSGWSYNEESARYKDLDPVFWIPSATRPIIPTGSSARPTFSVCTDPALTDQVQDAMAWSYETSYRSYRALIDAGIAREVARAVLGTGVYTSFYATANPRSVMHFLGLRTHEPFAATFVSYPQWEIEQGARELEKIFAQHWPATYRHWRENGRVAP